MKAPLPPPQQNLTGRIVQALGIAIVTGRYSDKTPFPVEGDLCVQYGASRSVLREAVKMLTAKGMLAARPRQGTRVQPESHWNLLDRDVLRWMLERKFSFELLIQFTQVRIVVEPGASALAARSAAPEQRAAISAGLARMFAAEHGGDDPLESDIAFHAAILHASNNPFYAQLTDLMATALRFSIRQTNATKGVDHASILDHKRVADAILAGDSAGAERAMRMIIQEALDLLHVQAGKRPHDMRDRANT